MIMKAFLITIALVFSVTAWIADAAPTLIEVSYVEVRGAVNRPGKIHWTPDMTVISACLRCGGIGWRLPPRVYILRGEERITIPLKAMLHGKEPDVKLQPGDVVDLTVPNSDF
jgi:protein involved in polysaccharide export with SLBB domain